MDPGVVYTLVWLSILFTGVVYLLVNFFTNDKIHRALKWKIKRMGRGR